MKYLGKVLTALYVDWKVVVVNLRKAQKHWAHMSQILGREGADPCTDREFYKAVVQATLLFGAESWLMSSWIGRTMGGFQHRVDRRLAKMHPKRYMTVR